MTNPPGAMPPLPDFPYDALWEPVRSLGWTTRGQTDEVIDALRPLVEDYAKAYAAPLIARVAELQAERDRIDRNRDMWKGQCERQAEQLTAMRKSLAFFVIHPGVWQLCSPDSEVMREAKASIDAAIAAKD